MFIIYRQGKIQSRFSSPKTSAQQTTQKYVFRIYWIYNLMCAWETLQKCISTLSNVLGCSIKGFRNFWRISQLGLVKFYLVFINGIPFTGKIQLKIHNLLDPRLLSSAGYYDITKKFEKYTTHWKNSMNLLEKNQISSYLIVRQTSVEFLYFGIITSWGNSVLDEV